MTELYIRPGRHRVVALHARNLVIDEVLVGSTPVQFRHIQRHIQRSLDSIADKSARDFADYVADDYRATLKAERTQGDLAIPLDGATVGGPEA